LKAPSKTLSMVTSPTSHRPLLVDCRIGVIASCSNWRICILHCEFDPRCLFNPGSCTCTDCTDTTSLISSWNLIYRACSCYRIYWNRIQSLKDINPTLLSWDSQLEVAASFAAKPVRHHQEVPPLTLKTYLPTDSLPVPSAAR
jgi:hypothetical protein